MKNDFIKIEYDKDFKEISIREINQINNNVLYTESKRGLDKLYKFLEENFNEDLDFYMALDLILKNFPKIKFNSYLADY